MPIAGGEWEIALDTLEASLYLNRLSTRAVSSYVFRFFNECALYPRSSANIFQGTKLTADSCTQIFIIILFIIPEYVRQFKCPLLWNQVK